MNTDDELQRQIGEINRSHIENSKFGALREKEGVPEDEMKSIGTPIVITRPDFGKIKRCPIWALVHRLDGKSVGASDRCNPGCQLYMGEIGDCAFKVIAVGVMNNAGTRSTSV